VELLTNLVIRETKPEDCEKMFALIKALAEYEKLSHLVTGNPQLLESHLFGSPRYAEAVVAEIDSNIVAFALFFHNYSTFLTKPGIYLEDIFVLPAFRGRGIGKAIFQKVAQLAVERGCGRLEWSVLDWNQSAIDFYVSRGAQVLDEWRICRLTGAALVKTASN
jgi:GNAT superfamily N-acetyltransferase